MEENKELETVTESQKNAGKGLFLSGIIVGFAATLLVVGGIFIAFQIHRIVTVKDEVSAQVSYDEDSAVNAQTIKKKCKRLHHIPDGRKHRQQYRT